MKPLPLSLTIEQEFTLKRYKIDSKNLSKDTAQELLIDTIQMLMIKDNVIKHLLKEGLGIQ